jgi:glucose-6-phosphate 1-dehydrogenase
MMTKPIDLNVDFAEALGESPLPYERLLNDALSGDSTLFQSEMAVEDTWAIVAPVLGDVGPIRTYERGTMGPEASDALCCDFGGWIEPLAPPSDRSA